MMMMKLLQTCDGISTASEDRKF